MWTCSFFRWNIIAYSWLDVCLENERTFWFKYECSGSALFSVYWRCAVELSIRETPYQKWYKGVQKVAMCICSTESNSFDCHNQCYCLKWKDNKRSYLHKLCSHSNHNTNILLALPLCLSFDTILFTMEPFCIVGFILISIYTYVTLFLLACIWQSWFFAIVFYSAANIRNDKHASEIQDTDH